MARTQTSVEKPTGALFSIAQCHGYFSTSTEQRKAKKKCRPEYHRLATGALHKSFRGFPVACGESLSTLRGSRLLLFAIQSLVSVVLWN